MYQKIQVMHKLLEPRSFFIIILLNLCIWKCNGELTNEKVAEEKKNSMGRFGLKCNDRCDGASDETEMDFMRQCMCDEHCSMYGDCCADAEHMNRTTAEHWANRFGCFDLSRDQSGAETFFMLSTCPTNWMDSGIRKLCENSEKLHDPLMNTPVTNKKTYQTFRNSYCAMCNGEHDPQETRLWTTEVTCPGLSNRMKVTLSNMTFTWNELNKTWTMEVPDDGVRKRSICTISYTLPGDLNNNVRSCIPHKRTFCSHELKAFCEAYLAPVQINNTTYKNLHCATCEGAIDHAKDDSEEIEDRKVTCGGPPPLESHPRIQNTFSVLFDFRITGSSDQVGGLCKSGELFDPFQKQCRAVFCPENKVLNQGRCIANPEYNPGTNRVGKVEDVEKRVEASSPKEEILADEQGLENQTCATLRLNISEYQLIENNTIYVIGSKKAFTSSEYQSINGSIFICAYNLTKGDKFDPYLRGFSIVFLGLSEVCLVIHITVGFFTQDFKNLSGKNIQSLCFSLFIGFGLFLIMQIVQVDVDTKACISISILVHYFYLAAFWWSSVMAYDVYKTLVLATTELRSPHNQTLRFVFYSLWAWLAPGIIVTMAVTVEYLDTTNVIPSKFHPHYGRDICWIGQKPALLLYFILPLAIILITNFILFFRTLRMISSNSLQRIESKREALLFLRLAVLMGLSWVAGIIAGAAQVTFLWYIFVALCASQGVFILICFTLNAKTVKIWYGNRISMGSRSTFLSSLRNIAHSTFQPSFYRSKKEAPQLIESQNKSSRFFKY